MGTFCAEGMAHQEITGTLEVSRSKTRSQRRHLRISSWNRYLWSLGWLWSHSWSFCLCLQNSGILCRPLPHLVWVSRLFFSVNTFITCLFIYVVWVWVPTSHVWRSKDSLRELVLPFYHVGSGNQIRFRLGGSCFYLLNHLADFHLCVFTCSWIHVCMHTCVNMYVEARGHVPSSIINFFLNLEFSNLIG